MWFKNIYVYRLTRPFEISPEQLGEHLEALCFAPCTNQQVVSSGWVPPLGPTSEAYTHAANGRIMLCLRRQEKVLPAAVVNEAVDEHIGAIEAAEHRKVSRKERDKVKDEVIFTLMPRAFARSSLHYAYIDAGAGLVVVNASSTKRAEELLDELREAIGSLPVIPLRPKGNPGQMMTSWLLAGTPPQGFGFGHECELRDPSEEGGIVRCKYQDLLSEEINNHLKAGMTATKLGLSWLGGIDCMIDDQLGIKRLKFDDLIEERADDLDAEGAAAQFDADFVLMTEELSGFFRDLLQAFGGEDLPEGMPAVGAAAPVEANAAAEQVESDAPAVASEPASELEPEPLAPAEGA